MFKRISSGSWIVYNKEVSVIVRCTGQTWQLCVLNATTWHRFCRQFRLYGPRVFILCCWFGGPDDEKWHRIGDVWEIIVGDDIYVCWRRAPYTANHKPYTVRHLYVNRHSHTPYTSHLKMKLAFPKSNTISYPGSRRSSNFRRNDCMAENDLAVPNTLGYRKRCWCQGVQQTSSVKRSRKLWSKSGVLGWEAGIIQNALGIGTAPLSIRPSFAS